MEAVAVITASLALAAGIIKATNIISELSTELRDVPGDMESVARELHAFQALLGPVSDGIARYKRKHDDPGGGSSDNNSGQQQDQSFAVLLRQIEDTLGGALAVVSQIEGMLRRYKGGGAVWRKLKWAMYGSSQMGKLRRSLESYKVALGIGLHVMSISIIGDIKGDTDVLGDVAEVIKLLQTDEVLSRLETRGKPSETRNKVETWLERMADYTSYAETTYQATTVDPDEQNREWDAINVPESVPEEEEKSESADPTTRRSLPSLWLQDSARRGSLSPFSSAVGGSSSQNLGTHTDLTVFSSVPPTTPDSATSVPSVRLSPALRPAKSLDKPESVEKEVVPSSDLEVVPSPNVKDAAAVTNIDWSPLVPRFLSEDDFRTLKVSAKLDKDAIARAWGAREQLSVDDKRRLDNRLLHAVMGSDDRSSAKRPSRCAILLGRGAMLDPAFSSTALIQTVEQRDSQTLAVLLRFGTDPESQTTGSNSRQPLTVAASSDVACMAALVLAGASIQRVAPRDVCDAFCQSGTQTLSIRLACSPLLAAFAGIRPHGKRSTDIRQFWMAHFLLANGANANIRTCTSVTELIVRHWPVQSQQRITKHLLGFGVDLVSTPEAASSSSLQFRYAVEAGITDLVRLLLDNGVHPARVSREGSPSQDPVVLAAENRRWACLDLMVERMGNGNIHVHLLSLVHVYMLKPSKLTPDSFRTSVQTIAAALRRDVTYARSELRSTWRYVREGGQEKVEEIVSAVELAQRAANKNQRNREEVVSLLQGETVIS